MANTVAIGKEGENIALDILKNSGFTIIATNINNALCPHDIVASKNNLIYTINVKYGETGYKSDNRNIDRMVAYSHEYNAIPAFLFISKSDSRYIFFVHSNEVFYWPYQLKNKWNLMEDEAYQKLINIRNELQKTTTKKITIEDAVDELWKQLKDHI